MYYGRCDSSVNGCVSRQSQLKIIATRLTLLGPDSSHLLLARFLGTGHRIQITAVSAPVERITPLTAESIYARPSAGTPHGGYNRHQRRA